jgi:PIN domain nuclease of toxin-antitoxin system
LSVLLDSSAWLAHLFGEPGVEQINLLFDDADNEIYISALSIPEVHGRLKAAETIL